jgi:hypothetical protein
MAEDERHHATIHRPPSALKACSTHSANGSGFGLLITDKNSEENNGGHCDGSEREI